MRVFTATLATETNSFSPFATGWESFREFGLHRGDSRDAKNVFSEGAAFLSRLAEAQGDEVVTGLITFAQPAGPTVRTVYEALRDELLEDLVSRGPFDAALLQLHGAMIADGYDDCEGDLLGHMRRRLGPKAFIGAVLDPHSHLTAAMTDAATALAVMKEYPHTDGAERLERLYHLCKAKMAGQALFAQATLDLRMLGVWPTFEQPMRGFVDELKAMEGQDGVHIVNVVHGFPWGDVRDNGAKINVVAEDAATAERTAERVGQSFWELREETRLRLLSIDEGIDRVVTGSGLVVLADVADNPGGGAPSDSTFVLRRLAERQITGVAIGFFWDPVGVRLCAEAGVGARFALRIGGKLGLTSGDPVDLLVTVRGVGEHQMETYNGGRSGLGQAAWVEADGIHIMLTTRRGQPMGPLGFTCLGLDISTIRGVVVKSTQHYQYGFAPIASEMHRLASPGALTMDLAEIPFQQRNLEYWPRVGRATLHG